MMNIDKWVKEYIEGVDLKKIKWIKLNATELKKFFDENYYDEENCEYVHDMNTNKLLGMSFLNFQSYNYISFHCTENEQTFNYLLGIVGNNIGKQTIVGAIIYLDNYLMFNDQDKPFTYISTIEVNSYFRNKGIFKKMCEVFFDYVNLDQYILTSEQTEMGRKCNVFGILKDILISKGFQKNVVEDDHQKTTLEIHDAIFTKQTGKVLKRTNN